MINIDADKKWMKHFTKIYKALYNMDKQKYLEPKFSTSIYPVMKFLHKRFGFKGAHTNISKISVSQRDGSPIGMAINDTNSLCSLISNELGLKAGSDMGFS